MLKINENTIRHSVVSPIFLKINSPFLFKSNENKIRHSVFRHSVTESVECIGNLIGAWYYVGLIASKELNLNLIFMLCPSTRLNK